MGAPWTEERVNQALRRCREGASAAIIAGELGTTKNAVVGMLYRKRPGPRGKVSPPTPAAQEEGPVTMMELTEQTCRWPIDLVDPLGRILFCGARVKLRAVYCVAHHKMSLDKRNFVGRSS